MALNLFLSILAAAHSPLAETNGLASGETRPASHPFPPAPDPLAEAVAMYRLMRTEGCDHPRALHGGAAFAGLAIDDLRDRIRQMWVSGKIYSDPATDNTQEDCDAF